MSATYPGPRSDGAPLPSLLRPLARRRALQLARAHQRNKQELAWRVQEVLAGCGLIETDYSISCGRVVNIPQVVSVIIGPVARVKIRLLVGQLPEDFTAKAETMAYHLGAAEVSIVEL
ncbi:MAG: hypothetical protein LC749_21545, partial [Actinobacteria bacterium]|nr:hypothetical protein [Actinomycetota bacterium]